MRHILENLGNTNRTLHDLYELNLLDQCELDVITTMHNIFQHRMIAMIVSDNIIKGDHNLFFKFAS